MKEVNPKELDAVMRLPPPGRYRNFLKTVVDWEEAWGLFDGGWAMSETPDGRKVLSLWPAKAFAEACAAEQWEGYSPEPISLDDLVSGLLPKLQQDGVLPGVFFTPEQGSVEVAASKLIEDTQAASRELE